MEENNMNGTTGGMPENPQEAPQGTPASIPVQPASPVSSDNNEPPKKKKGLLIGGVVAACAVVVIGAVSAVALLGSSPEKQVQKAVLGTFAQNAKQIADIHKNFPGSEYLLNQVGSKDATRTEFEMQIKDMSMPGASAADNAAFAFIAGSSLEGSIVSDAPGTAFEFDGKFKLGSVDFIDAYMYVSPETAAFHIPAASDTVLSINPRQLAEDYRNASPYLKKEMGITDAEIDDAQFAIDIVLNVLEIANDMDENSKLVKDLTGIAEKNMKNTTYEKGEKVKGANTYIIHIPSQDIRAMAHEMVSYIFLEAKESEKFKTVIEARDDVDDYETYVKEEILDKLDEDFGYFDVEIDLQIQKNIIHEADINVYYISEEDMDDPEDYTYGKSDLIMQAVYSRSEDGSEETMEITMVDEYVGNSTNTMSRTLSEDVLEIVTTTEASGTTQTISYEFDKEGNCTMDMKMDINDGYSNQTATMTAEGTIVKEGEGVTISFPDMSFDMAASGTALAMKWSFDATIEPIDSPYLIPKEHTNVLTMSQSEIEAEIEKYDEWAASLQMILMQALLGM